MATSDQERKKMEMRNLYAEAKKRRDALGEKYMRENPDEVKAAYRYLGEIDQPLSEELRQVLNRHAGRLGYAAGLATLIGLAVVGTRRMLIEQGKNQDGLEDAMQTMGLAIAIYFHMVATMPIEGSTDESIKSWDEEGETKQ